MFFTRTLLWVVAVAAGCSCLHAQTKERWRRVYTGEYSLIEINVSSVTLEPDRVLRVEFRTTLVEPEHVAGKKSAKYKSRIETIRFKLDQERYQLGEITWFDGEGAKLGSYAPSKADWRVVKQGGVTQRMFNAARTLPPFGNWRVVDYKFADGSTEADPLLARLIGKSVRLQSRTADVGSKFCSAMAYEDRRISKDELNRQLGIKLDSLGIVADYVQTTNLKCEGGGWAPPQSLLLKVKEDEMLMLWDGVFLVLKLEH